MVLVGLPTSRLIKNKEHDFGFSKCMFFFNILQRNLKKLGKMLKKLPIIKDGGIDGIIL